MKLIKKGSKEWHSRVKSATSYRERIDYLKLSQLIVEAEVGDFVQVSCQHNHRSNLVSGLSRKELIQNTHYKLKPSKDDQGEEIILIEKLGKGVASK